jgi:hypothetical protein
MRAKSIQPALLAACFLSIFVASGWADQPPLPLESRHHRHGCARVGVDKDNQ